MNDFVDCGTYWQHIHAQGSDSWKQIRLNLLTASKFRKCRGIEPWAKKDLPVLIYDLQNGVDSTVPNELMAHGNLFEPIAREWYEETYQCKVQTVGLAIPKWNKFIGASPDGLIGDDGGLEIKCPKIMYPALVEYMSKNVKLNPNQYYDIDNYNHIKRDHFDQIQGCLAVYNRKWWDYCVFASESKQCFVQRIPRFQEYWEQEAYPDIQKFLLQVWGAAQNSKD